MHADYTKIYFHNIQPISTAPIEITPAEVTAYLEKNGISIDAPTGPVTPITAFNQLTVSSELRRALNGFKEPTPIQACAWPALLSGNDVVGIAETGRRAFFLRVNVHSLIEAL